MNATEAALRFRARQDAGRRCEKCGKPTERLKRWCHACGAAPAKQREYRERNKEVVAAKQREYRERNKEVVAAKKRTAWTAAPPRCSLCGKALEYQGRGRPPRFCTADNPKSRARSKACDRQNVGMA